jgi:hypothetical protein
VFYLHMTFRQMYAQYLDQKHRGEMLSSERSNVAPGKRLLRYVDGGQSL